MANELPTLSLFRSQRNTIGISTVADALPRTINAPEVIFYKPASHSTLQTKFMGFHVHVKRCLNPSDYFFFVEQPFKWLIKSWKKDNYTFSNAKVKTYSFATDTAQILKYTYTVSVPTIKHDHKGNNLN